ncbi:MAG: phenylacetic acid degradation bifunctional protein PaaZ [Gammaproteobacteria bacterium]|nr:phenylacetic acid degradation bifunctional protein PaaZ [Gammaproteobacteria bacterium]NNM20759.1 phenylacetic acid degradation bifunctional protein PaaZ [Gammaproteobacteria bacterium]
MKLQSYVAGRWLDGSDTGRLLVSAVDGHPVASISSAGLDFSELVSHARTVGSPNLRALTFHQRAHMLKALAKGLLEHKKEFYELSTQTGATRADSWIDIDGGISTLFVYSGKGRRELPNDYVLCDGAPEIVSRNGTFVGQHIYTPLRGVAVHINAFNFPCWGMLEKLAPALLAGMPAIVKPASSTAYLTEAMVRRIIELDILPPGALQLVCGSTGDLLGMLDCQDVVAFTGSKTTADMLRQHPNIIANSVRFTAETDSLNCAVLGTDAVAGTPEFGLYIDEIVREITSKAGQKCTAIRRIIAPRASAAALVETLAQRLAAVRVGNPASKEVDMGALASTGQRDEVRERVAELAGESEIVFGDPGRCEVLDADAEKGAFFAPVLLHCDNPVGASAPHDVEAFGPVATVLPYDDLEQAAWLAHRGAGSLAGSIYTYDDDVARMLALELAPFHGRLVLINRDCAGESTGHGSPLPHLVHGGPGRAGGSEELGGVRGVKHYMQRSALQGSPATLAAITNRWIRGGREKQPSTHPFRLSFEELEIGHTLRTAEREITLADIERFADLSGDRFYAHMNEADAARNPFFDGRVAHGYFLVSAAAGLFVDAPFGPVLANYGLDDLRFTQPVNPGDSIRVRLTCKQKTLRPDQGYGEVRWDTEVINQNDEVVAAYDVLTMVATADKMRELRAS